MGRGDVKTRKGKIFRGSFGNKRQRNTNKSVKPKLQLNEKKLQPVRHSQSQNQAGGRNKIAPVKPELDPVMTSQDEAGRKEIQPKLDTIPSTQDGAGKEHPGEIEKKFHGVNIQQGREEKEILEKEKEKIKDKTESAKSTGSGQTGKEKKPVAPPKSGQDKPKLNKNEIKQSSPPENPDKSESETMSQGKSEKESK